jgi:hypothetical protein
VSTVTGILSVWEAVVMGEMGLRLDGDIGVWGGGAKVPGSWAKTAPLRALFINFPAPVSERSVSALSALSDLIPTSRQVRLGPILLKKSEYRLGSMFPAPQVRFSNADAGDLVVCSRTNVANSKWIYSSNPN